MNLLNGLIFRRMIRLPIQIPQEELHRRVTEFPEINIGGMITSWKNSKYMVSEEQGGFTFARKKIDNANIVIAEGAISNENVLELKIRQPKVSNYFIVGFIVFIAVGTILVSFTGKGYSSYPPFILIGIVYVLNVISFLISSQRMLIWVRNFVSERPVT